VRANALDLARLVSAFCGHGGSVLRRKCGPRRVRSERPQVNCRGALASYGNPGSGE
jgi:hypothetical protein